MANTHSFSELHYGFDKVFSNIPVDRLRPLWQRVEDADRQSPFLQPEKNMLVVDLNRFHLEGMLERIAADALHEYTQGSLSEHFIPEQRPGISYPHHTTPTVVNFYRSQDHGEQPAISLIYSRVKQRDSLTEKVTRLFAAKQRVNSPLVDELLGKESHHIDADDCYAVTFVCDSESTLYAVHRQLRQVSYLVPLTQPKDYIRQPKSTGYRAVHDKLLFVDGVEGAYGLLLDVHLETVADHQRNKEGDNQDSGRSHYAYSWSKLRTSPHQQGPNQIIIFEKNGHDHEHFMPVGIKTRIRGEEISYTLINY